jgi:hypothetical protein
VGSLDRSDSRIGIGTPFAYSPPVIDFHSLRNSSDACPATRRVDSAPEFTIMSSPRPKSMAWYLALRSNIALVSPTCPSLRYTFLAVTTNGVDDDDDDDDDDASPSPPAAAAAPLRAKTMGVLWSLASTPPSTTAPPPAAGPAKHRLNAPPRIADAATICPQKLRPLPSSPITPGPPIVAAAAAGPAVAVAWQPKARGNGPAAGPPARAASLPS